MSVERSGSYELTFFVLNLKRLEKYCFYLFIIAYVVLLELSSEWTVLILPFES